VTAALLLWCARSLYATTRFKHLSMSMPKLGVEADFFIPFAWRRLRHGMLESLASSHERRWMKVFFEKLESWLHAKSYGDTKRALQDFAIFDPMANPRDFSYLPPEKIEQLQDRFLSNCQTMLLSAGFKPVTREELMWALGEDYLSTIPIEINWDALDKGLFKLYREQRDTTAEGNVADVGLPPESEKREQAFLPSNRVWVFRRGIGTTRTKDYFFFQKLDHMISMAYGWLLERIRSVFGKIAPPRAQAPLQPEVPEGASIQPLAENQPADGDTNVIQRVTLHDEVAEKGIKCLFQKSILEEATYKEVLVLYRRATPTEESPDPTESSAKNNRAIFIKVFHDIPIADLEMVFPEKRVRMPLWIWSGLQRLLALA